MAITGARGEIRASVAAEEQPALMARDTPPWFARALAWGLIALFIVVVLAAIFVKVPETVRAPFVLVPRGAVDPIESPRQAVLENVRIAPGDEVKEGQILFVLRTDEVREWRADTDSRTGSLSALRARSTELERSHAAAIQIKWSEIEQVEQEARFREQHVATMRELTRRMEQLAEKGVTSDNELISRRLSLAQAEAELGLTRKSLTQKKLEMQRLETDRRQQRIEEKSQADELQIRISSLEEPLARSRGGLLEIRAPYDAVCVDVTKQADGSVVAPGQALAQLVPKSSALRARLQLPEDSLANLESGQRVRLFFDAFPYQRHGVVPGRLEWVSPAAVRGEREAEFLAFAALDRTTIGQDGKSRELRAGMRGQARIVTGRRALIEYVFEPLRKLRENVRD